MPRGDLAVVKRVCPELSTYSWIRLRDHELVAAGVDPSDRVRLTGHRHPLPEQWIDSIGLWGAHESKDLISATAPHQAILHVTPAAYRKFKSRHRLDSGRQFQLRHGYHPWRRAELCYIEHADAQRAFSVGGALAPLGVACEYALAISSRRPRRARIGLLPVEVVLWTRVLDALLSCHGLTFEDWGHFDAEEKTIVWDSGHDGAPWDVDMFLRAPAAYALATTTLGATG